jgi:hypothetical protein
MQKLQIREKKRANLRYLQESSAQTAPGIILIF